ncbi:uncharacterized protein LOC126837029 [Adelges cooleyi]|uniref:uncharacterized protein LOC126837029 n=1 Tax=Adelges cooleyi TaxID=133065 RepID=UPI0021805C3B|nr:uncharacterized protein LOC126837029 [Adelges cooleyi]
MDGATPILDSHSDGEPKESNHIAEQEHNDEKKQTPEPHCSNVKDCKLDQEVSMLTETSKQIGAISKEIQNQSPDVEVFNFIKNEHDYSKRRITRKSAANQLNGQTRDDGNALSQKVEFILAEIRKQSSIGLKNISILSEQYRRSRCHSPTVCTVKFSSSHGQFPSRKFYDINGKLMFADGQNFTYIQTSTTSNNRKLRCSKNNLGCRSTATMPLIPENSPIIVHHQHCHGPGNDIEIALFLEVLREAPSKDNSPLKDIYDNACRRFPNAAIEIPRCKAFDIMRLVRSKRNPPVPENLKRMAETIVSEVWGLRLLNTTDDDNDVPFFRSTLEYVENETVITGGLVFSNVEFLLKNKHHLIKANTLVVDSSLGVVPLSPSDVDQLVTIHAVLNKFCVPVAYAILNGKTEGVYLRLLEYLRKELLVNLFDWKKIKIISNFETTLRSSIKKVIPKCKVVGCWFYFNQSIIGFVQKNDMVPLIHSDYRYATILRLIVALPLLPPKVVAKFPKDFHIVGAFEAIQKMACRLKMNQFHKLFEFVQFFWIGLVGPAAFTVHSQDIRVNNFIESFHSSLRSLIGVHPPVWKFYDRLRLVEYRVRKEASQLMNGRRVESSIVLSRGDTCNSHLATALENIRNGKTDTLDYLKRASYYTKNYIHQHIGMVPYDDLAIDQLTIPVKIRSRLTPNPQAMAVDDQTEDSASLCHSEMTFDDLPRRERRRKKPQPASHKK